VKMDDFDDIKKLDPLKRAKKLKELIEARNKEIADKNKDIGEAEKLTKQAEKEKEELIALQEQIKVPGVEEVDISNLFQQEEEEKLEDTVAKEAPPDEEGPLKGLYQVSPDMATSQIYSDIVNIYNSMGKNGQVSPAMASQAGAIQYAMEKKDEAVEQGNYSPTENIQQQADTIKNMTDKILSIYTAGTKRKKAHEK